MQPQNRLLSLQFFNLEIEMQHLCESNKNEPQAVIG